MDLTDFLVSTKKKKKEILSFDSQDVDFIKKKRQYMEYADILYNNDIIDILEFQEVINFIKYKGSLVHIGKFISICKRIIKKDINCDLSNNFFLIILDLFPHIFLKKKTSNNEWKDIINIIPSDIVNLIKKEKIGIINLTKDQIIALEKIISFLVSEEECAFGLFGYAGTGKTTLVTELIYSLLKSNYVRSIALTAPTHKAVNIMKSKFRTDLITLLELKTNKKVNHSDPLSVHLEILRKQGIRVEFSTIHGLLNYNSEINSEGERIFTKSESSKIKNYDLVIVDECSMIPIQIINDIFKELHKNPVSLKGEDRVPKLIYVGDPAQLPPVNEMSSSIFIDKENSISLDLFKTAVNDDNYDENGFFKVSNEKKIIKDLKILEKRILKINKFTLTSIVRSKKKNIVGISKEIRDWVINNDDKKPVIGKYQGPCVHLYFKKKFTSKLSSKWLNNCISGISIDDKKSIENNIILTWTNRQSDEYNRIIRQTIFEKNDLNKFENGDILILNNFYNLDETKVEKELKKNNKKNTRFYTSEQIKVIDIKEVTRVLPPLRNTFKKSAKQIDDWESMLKIYQKEIKKVNRITKKKFKSFQLDVIRLTEKITTENPKVYRIFVVHDDDLNLLEEERLLISKTIRKIRNQLKSIDHSKERVINEYIIRPLWIEYNRYYNEPFANVSYGYSTTVHKSQGSTYYTVYVDMNDIKLNIKNNPNETKRCIYTAITRASNALHLLI